MTLRRRGVLIASLGLVLLVAACSSNGSGGGTGSTSSQSRSRNTCRVLVFGIIGSFSGAVGSQGGPIAASAWAAKTNDAGGLNGSQVRVVTVDTASATGAGLTGAKKLIENDHAVALFDFDEEDSTWLPYAETKGVPVIAFTTSGSATSPDAFPITEAQLALAYALPSLGKTLGDRFGIIYCAETPSCGGLGSLITKNAKTIGLDIPVSLKVSSSAPDYTAACQSLKSAGVQGYVVISGAALVKKIADQCYQQGLHAKLVQNGAQVATSWKSDPAMDGVLISDNAAPYFSDASPAHAAYRAALTQYASKSIGGDLDNSLMEVAWLQGELISAAATHVTGAITAQSLKQGLYALKGETLGGMIQPVTYTPNEPTSLPCYFSWSIEGGQYTAVNGDKYMCAPASALGG